MKTAVTLILLPVAAAAFQMRKASLRDMCLQLLRNKIVLPSVAHGARPVMSGVQHVESSELRRCWLSMLRPTMTALISGWQLPFQIMKAGTETLVICLDRGLWNKFREGWVKVPEYRWSMITEYSVKAALENHESRSCRYQNGATSLCG